MRRRRPNALALPFTRLMTRAGVDLLPDWAKQQLGMTPLRPLQQALLQRAVGLAAKPVRWAASELRPACTSAHGRLIRIKESI